MKIILVALVVLGCATGTIKPETRAAERNSKLVQRVYGFSTGHGCDLDTLHCYNITWPSSGWNRQEDLAEPYYVVLAGDGTACPIWDFVVNPPRPEHYWICSVPWRVRRTQVKNAN